MTKFNCKFYLIFLPFLFSSCNNANKDIITGEWREYIDDSTVTDYTLLNDTISIKVSSELFICRYPYYYKDLSYNRKVDSVEIFKIIRMISEDTILINSGLLNNTKFVRLKDCNNKIPSIIKFDLINPIPTCDSNIIEGLGDGDYKLYSDGTYKFYTHNKIYQGQINTSLNEQLHKYISLTDSFDKSLTRHFFSIHFDRFNYNLQFQYDKRIDNYLISEKQPIQLTRVTYCLETIWYEILSMSGYMIE